MSNLLQLLERARMSFVHAGGNQEFGINGLLATFVRESGYGEGRCAKLGGVSLRGRRIMMANLGGIFLRGRRIMMANLGGVFLRGRRIIIANLGGGSLGEMRILVDYLAKISRS